MITATEICLNEDIEASLREIKRLRAVVHRMVRDSNGCAAPCETQCGCWVEAEKEMEP